MLIGANAAGLNNKLDSFQRLISLFTPGVIFIQESKAKRKGLIKADNYVIFEQLRKSSGGGGLLTAVHHNLSPVSINDEKDDILVVQAKVGTKSVRLINAYGPQENSSEDITNEFFNNLDTEVKKASWLEQWCVWKWMLIVNLDQKLFPMILMNNRTMEKNLKRLWWKMI